MDILRDESEMNTLVLLRGIDILELFHQRKVSRLSVVPFKFEI